MIAVLTLLPAIAGGTLFVRGVVGKSAHWTAWAAPCGLGIALGLGVRSTLFFALLWAGVSNIASVMAVDALCVAAGWACWRRAAPAPADGGIPAEPPLWRYGMRAAALLVLAVVALDVAEAVATHPAGEFDAVAMWNRKARFLASGTQSWREFNQVRGAAHPGYGMLLPGSIAATWKLNGGTEAPVAVAAGFGVAVALTALGSVAAAGGEVAGLTALLVLLASTGFTAQIAMQYADVPVGAYILGTFALLLWCEERAWPPRIVALAGLFAGLAAWTKDEGLVFAILALAAIAWRSPGKALLAFIAGVAPLLILVAAFKLTVGRANDPYLPTAAGQLSSQLLSPVRWWQVVAAYARSVWQMGLVWAHPVLLFVAAGLAFGWRARAIRRHLHWLVILSVLIVAEAVTYLASPNGLTWYLETSNLRLVAQLWPTLVVMAFLCVRPAAFEAAPAELPVERKRRR